MHPRARLPCAAEEVCPMPCPNPLPQTCTRFFLGLLIVAFALGLVSVAYHEALPTHFA